MQKGLSNGRKVKSLRRQPSTVHRQPNCIYKLHSYKNGSYNCLTKAKRPFLKPISFFKKGLWDLLSLANLFFRKATFSWSTLLNRSRLPLLQKGGWGEFKLGIGTALLLLTTLSLQAQNDCPTCETLIPDSLQVDTFFLDELPDGLFQSAYTGNVSFRLPVNTNEVLYLDPNLPPNVGLSSIKVKSISNLPAGLIWTPSQDNYSLPEERNGCVMICGRPLQHGLFEVDITVTASISILDRDATFSRTLFIAPPSSDNSGFSMNNNIGCGETTVTFENNNPSNGKAGFSYLWDFGNGASSEAEIPQAQLYETPGTYPVNYQVVIDTIGAVLTEITILESDCDDILGKPDFYFKLFDAQDTLIMESSSIDNTEPPVRFPLSMNLSSSSYRLEIWDVDSGVGFQDDSCGVFTFTPAQSDTLKTEDLSVLLTILHSPDTIQIQDSVIVYPLPSPPMIEVAEYFFCEGDTMLLQSSYTQNVEWFKDGLPIGVTDVQLPATSTGEYHVSYTSPDGCVVFSEPVFLETINPPGAPVFSNNDNVLQLFNPDILPTTYALQWFQEGNLLEEASMELCITETGKYGLQLTDTNTGCATLFETVTTANDQVDCTTSIPELTDYLSVVEVYPTPTSGRLSIDFVATQSLENLRLRVISILGQPVIEQNYSTIQGAQKLSVDLSSQVAGIYWVVLESEVGVSSWKVVKKD